MRWTTVAGGSAMVCLALAVYAASASAEARTRAIEAYGRAAAEDMRERVRINRILRGLED